MKPDNILSARLKKFAELDGTSAERLSVALEMRFAPPKPPLPDPGAGRKAAAWLKEFESPPDIVILPGIGRPGRVESMLELLPETSKVLVIEREYQAAAGFFLRYPVEDLVEQGRLRMALGEDPDVALANLLAVMDMPKCPSLGIFSFPELPAEDIKLYESILKKIRDGIRANLMNMCTLATHGPLWQYNTIRNLPILISNPGVSQLADIFTNRPAIVVAAGPSLNKALKQFRNIADRFVIISVGTALKPLRKAGVKPDIVVTVDASRLTGAQFDIRCNNLYLACSSIAFPEVLPKFKGIFSGCINVNPVGKWISSFGDEKGAIYSGGTVSATAIDLAVKMGCNPVICTGLDLCAAADGTSHADNTMYHGHHEKEGSLIPTPGNYRETVYTNKQFFVYRELISAYVRNHTETRFINATDDGARIEDMELRPTSDIPSFAAEPRDSHAMIRNRYESWTQPETSSACAEIEKVIQLLGEIREGATEAAMITNELIVMMRSPSRENENDVRQKLDALNAFDEKIIDQRESSLVIDMSLRPIYYMMGKKLERPNERCSDAVAANIQSRNLYKQMVGAAAWTEKLLEIALKEIRSELPPSVVAPDLHSKEICNNNNMEILPCPARKHTEALIS